MLLNHTTVYMLECQFNTANKFIGYDSFCDLFVKKLRITPHCVIHNIFILYENSNRFFDKIEMAPV